MREKYVTKNLQRILPEFNAKLILEPEYEYCGCIIFPNGKRTFFNESIFGVNPQSSVRISKDKGYSNFFLKTFGFNIPDYDTFVNEEINKHLIKKKGKKEALEFCHKIGFPVIIKPNKGAKGRLVYKLNNELDFYHYSERVFRESKTILIQKFVEGNDFRIVVFDRKVYCAYQRTRSRIIGDGKHSILELLKEKHPSIETHLSGVVMLSNAFGEAANKDLSTLIPAMYLVIILTLILLVLYNTGFLKGISGGLKSVTTAVSVTFATLLVLMFSILGGVGIMSYLGVELTSVSVSAPTMILTLAVADSIHILITMLQGMRGGLAKKAAIIESLRINFMPVFITSATTVVGFLTMNFSDSPPFRDLGNIAATGVALAFLFSVTLLPALLAILPMWVRDRSNEARGTTISWLDNLANFVIAKRRPLLLGSLAVTGLLVFFASRNQLNEQFVEYFDDSIEFRRATDFMADNLTGIYTIEYSVSSGEEGGISNPQFLNTLERFENWFEENEKVVHVSTYTDVARKVNKSMHGDNPTEYKLPENREEAAQYLLLYEMSLPFGLDLNNQINVDKSETRFIATVDNITATELIELSEAGEKWLTDNGIQGESNLGISTAIMFAHLTQRQIYSMAEGGIWAILLISIVLIIALRSFKFGLLSIIPNIVPVAIAFGVWFFLSGQITSGLAIVFSMTIGIVVDDTVHLFSKYLRARREQNKSSEEAIRYAFSTVGMAIVTTTVVLSAGFFILGQSSFAMNSGMAQLTAITIIAALIIDLLFLPSVIMAVDKKRV